MTPSLPRAFFGGFPVESGLDTVFVGLNLWGVDDESRSGSDSDAVDSLSLLA